MNYEDRVKFFYEHAGWSYGPGETSDQGKLRCAIHLADVEVWAQGKNLTVQWIEDTDADRSWLEDEPDGDDGRILWGCQITLLWDGRADCASLWGIDIDATDNPYVRVVEAEMCDQLKHRWECDRVGLAYNTPSGIVRDAMMDAGIIGS